jgi:hypothetical protein
VLVDVVLGGECVMAERRNVVNSSAAAAADSGFDPTFAAIS